MEEAYTGCQKTIVTTGNAYEKKTVSIPAGVNTGDRLKLHGCGSSKIENLPPGDHIINIIVVDHHRFRRRGADLQITVSVGVFEAMFGLKVKLTHLDGQELRFNIPSGTQPNQTIRLKGKGMPIINSNNKGDLYVTVNVYIPKLSDEEKNRLNQMAGARNAEISI
jgi:DnaJ-class molecular chaperone